MTEVIARRPSTTRTCWIKVYPLPNTR